MCEYCGTPINPEEYGLPKPDPIIQDSIQPQDNIQSNDNIIPPDIEIKTTTTLANFFIYFGCFIGMSAVQVFLKYDGIILGPIPLMLLCLATLKTASLLCKKYQISKYLKANQKNLNLQADTPSVQPQSTNQVSIIQSEPEPETPIEQEPIPNKIEEEPIVQQSLPEDHLESIPQIQETPAPAAVSDKPAFCPYCGTKYRDGDLFCSRCGKKVVEE